MTRKVQSISVIKQLTREGTENQLLKQDFSSADGTCALRGVAWERVSR